MLVAARASGVIPVRHRFTCHPSASSPQKPLLLSSKLGSDSTSPLTCRSCQPLPSLGKELTGGGGVGGGGTGGGVSMRRPPPPPWCFFLPQYCQWLRGSPLCLPEPEDRPGDAEAKDHQPLPHEEVRWPQTLLQAVLGCLRATWGEREPSGFEVEAQSKSGTSGAGPHAYNPSTPEAEAGL